MCAAWAGRVAALNGGIEREHALPRQGSEENVT